MRFTRKLSVGFVLLFAMKLAVSCASMDATARWLIQEEDRCRRSGGTYILDKGCIPNIKSDPNPPVSPQPSAPPAPPAPGRPSLPGPSEPLPLHGQACAGFGHTGLASYRKSMDSPAPQFRVEPGELEGLALEACRITAEVTGFGQLALADRDSFFMLIETMRPGGYRVVFSGDTWRSGADMMTRWTVQHFPPGAQRMEPMGEFEHWLYPDRKYLYDCSWDRAGALCRVSQAEEGWSAERAVEIKAPLGQLVKPLVFGDKAAEPYQSMGPSAMTLRTCLSIY
ncbi:MAG: hypothetical protein OEV92_02400 [Nitrospinota bacterium]|nr:hypothetical protein [Nitrospinota bacterium]